jgi:hypothetical protein
MNAAGSRSVHAFVDKKTGELYKSSSWKSPAKGVRFDLPSIEQREWLLQHADWAGGLSLQAMMYLQTQHFPQMTDYQQEIKDLTVYLRLLCNGFSDFATFAYTDERMTTLLAELASEFVDANIPVVDEDNRITLINVD